VYGYRITGGLVDGPVAGDIFSSLRGVRLSRDDPYERFQSAMAVYHDDWADYSTNEPTMDGTAGLILPLASLAAEGSARDPYRRAQRSLGALVRLDTTEKTIYLCFTGHEFAEGGEQIAATLRVQNVQASFFFTGDFYRKAAFRPLVLRLREEGHYLGAHSDRHLLYCTWEVRDSLLVTREEFVRDVRNNYAEMARFGIAEGEVRYFLPPYEWYNRSIVRWTGEIDLTLVNYTPGTRSHADYTTPDMGSSYVSSEAILGSVLHYEATQPSGLNGFILLMHIGTAPERTDKLYVQLGDLLDTLVSRGYRFSRIDDLLDR